MKRIKYKLLLFLATLTVSSYGDIIIVKPPSKICIKIGNTEDYPDINLVNVSDCMAVNKISNKAFIVDPNTWLMMRKECPLVFYAVKKSYLERKYTKDIDWEADKNIRKSNITIDEKIFNANEPAIKTVEINYNIAGFDNTSMILYKTAQVIKYNDERPDSVQYFSYEGDLSKLRKDFD